MEFPERDKTNYKWKIFYFNPLDKRVIVPKPNPDFGISFNFAHKKAYLFLLPILFIPAFILLLKLLLEK